MNSAAIESRTWKSGRWLLLFILVFALQLLLIYLLSARTPAVAVTSQGLAPSALIQLSTRPISEPEFASTFLANDPTLFAMANLHGFSGAAWLKVPSRNYDLAQTPEEPFWLALDSDELGNGITRFVRTNTIAPVAIAGTVAPRILASIGVGLPPNAKSKSELRIEGDLASRKMLDAPELKSWAHSEILSNSVVQISVDQGGSVISPRLLSRSGLPEADAEALAMARGIRFTPGKKAEPTWGKLVFDWHTVPLVVTNAPSVNPK